MNLRLLKNIKVGIKLRFGTFLAFGIFLAVVVFIVNKSVENLTIQTGRRQVEQEAEVIQKHFAEVEQSLLVNAKILASRSDLTQAITSGDADRAKTAVLVSGAPFDFDDINIVDADDARLVDIDEIASAHEDNLLSLALLGIETTGVVVKEQSAATFSLAATVPLRDKLGEIFGGIVASRRVDEKFLQEINFSRKGISLLLIHQGQILSLAQEDAQQSALLAKEAAYLDPVAIDQALDGQIVVANDLIYLDGAPHVMAHMPLIVRNQAQAVIVILINMDALLVFQKQLTASLFYVLGFLTLVTVGGMLIFSRQSIINPINKLQRVARRMSAGDYSQRAEIKSSDEFGQLARAFNEMSDAIQRREEELTLARDQSLAASRLKGQLLANVSHDLRTPLAAILGHTEMLQRGTYGTLSDQQCDITQRVIHNTRGLTEMVSKLMNQAQIESGTLKFENNAFAPHELVERMQFALKTLAEDKGLQLTSSVASDMPPTLHGDLDWVYQILANLVENAVKFTEHGSVEARIYQPDETHWAIQVTDTGPGIPVEAQSYVFDVFRQVDGTTTRKHGGSGLGLAIVKQLTTMMGGQIVLKSKPGQGSTFTVLLPLVPKQEAVL